MFESFREFESDLSCSLFLLFELLAVHVGFDLFGLESFTEVLVKEVDLVLALSH